MRLVVDASVAVKWFVEEEYSAEAGRLLESGYELHAPRLLTLEVGNALWRKARMGELERNRAGDLAATIPDMPVRWAEDDEYCPDAVLLALALDRTVYDSLYLALAHRIRATLVTADARFVNALAATEHGGAVVALHDLALARTTSSAVIGPLRRGALFLVTNCLPCIPSFVSRGLSRERGDPSPGLRPSQHIH